MMKPLTCFAGWYTLTHNRVPLQFGQSCKASRLGYRGQVFPTRSTANSPAVNDIVLLHYVLPRYEYTVLESAVMHQASGYIVFHKMSV